jgi:hypothetical protein
MLVSTPTEILPYKTTSAIAATGRAAIASAIIFLFMREFPLDNKTISLGIVTS